MYYWCNVTELHVIRRFATRCNYMHMHGAIQVQTSKKGKSIHYVSTIKLKKNGYTFDST